MEEKEKANVASAQTKITCGGSKGRKYQFCIFANEGSSVKEMKNSIVAWAEA